MSRKNIQYLFLTFRESIRKLKWLRITDLDDRPVRTVLDIINVLRGMFMRSYYDTIILIRWYSAQFTIRYDTVTTARRRLGSKLLPGFALNGLNSHWGRICRFHLFPISSRNFRSHRPAI